MSGKIRKQKRLLKRYTNGKLIWRNIRFFIFYLILLALIGYSGYFVYTYLDECLVAYESAQSHYVSDEFAKVFSEYRFDELYEYENASSLTSETKEDYIAYMRELIEGTYIEYSEVPSKDAAEKKFKVTSNGKSFATFTIRKNGEKTDCGFLGEVDLYEPGTITTDILQPITYTYTIPQDATLYVDKQPISEEYLVERDIKTFASGHLPSSLQTPDLCTYRFTKALGVPDIFVIDKDGAKLELTQTAQDTYAYSYKYSDDEMKPVFEEYVVNAAKALCMFTTENTTLKNLLAYMKPGSSAESYCKNVDRMWLTKADKYSFSDIRTENYVSFSDTIFSCEVHLVYNTVSRKVENSYPSSVRFYLEHVGNTCKIYDIEFLQS